MNIKRITVMGGGNIGVQLACICASKGYDVIVYTSKAECFSKDLEIIDENGVITQTGHISTVTYDIQVAMNTDMCLITYPAQFFEGLSKKMLPYLKEGLFIGIIPGFGGAEFAFHDFIEAGAILFGLQRVPSVARVQIPGKRVLAMGKRDSLKLASIPSRCATEISDFISDLIDIKCDVLPNYLCITMTPSNPILHTTRLCTMFSDYEKGKTYDRNPLFYGEWSDASSELLLSCDDEHQSLLRVIEQINPQIDLSTVKSLKEHYESNSIIEMTKKISSIASLHNITSPMIKNEDNRWELDTDSRYFKSDFPFGLAIIESFSKIFNINCPNIKFVMDWYNRVIDGSKTPIIEDIDLNIYLK